MHIFLLSIVVISLVYNADERLFTCQMAFTPHLPSAQSVSTQLISNSPENKIKLLSENKVKVKL